MALNLLLIVLFVLMVVVFRATHVLAFRLKAYMAFIFANLERSKYCLPPLKCEFPSIWKMIFSFRGLRYKNYFSQEILDEVQL